MLKTRVILPDGRILSSGAREEMAIQSAKLTQCVNSREELTLGSVCASMLEMTVLDPDEALGLSAGEEITVSKVGDDGTSYPVGIFLTEKPVRVSANCVKVTAYDRVSLLDKDLTSWLAALDGWPYTLLEFAKMVGEACGVTLTNDAIPNGEYPVQAFSGQGITGRQLIQWVGEIAGRFCRATTEGNLEFAWYAPKDLVLSPSGERYYYLGGLSLADYQVAEIEKVHIRLTDSDVGEVYPPDLEQGNTYAITGNYLLTADSTEVLQTVAQNIFEQLQGVSYTPCKIVAPADTAQAGDIIKVLDKRGVSHSVYVMSKVQTGQTETLECTGSSRRDSSTTVNEAKYAALSGKVLELQMGVEGLRMENKEAAGKMASVEMNVEGLTTVVSGQMQATDSLHEEISTVRQSVEGVSVSVENIHSDGVSKVQTETGYTFDSDGLKISKSGEEMENRLDNTGMYVEKNGEVILRANNQGVEAADITVRNYLIIGSNSRFEDYGDGRTGCFWIGG